MDKSDVVELDAVVLIEYENDTIEYHGLFVLVDSLRDMYAIDHFRSDIIYAIKGKPFRVHVDTYISGRLYRGESDIIMLVDSPVSVDMELYAIGEVPTSGVLNGHEWIDLGLPSGTLWATTNVGAINPEDYGGYYAWGETATKENYDWSTYKYCNGSYNTLTKYCNFSGYGYNGFTDNLTILETEDDAATVNWGEGWRMPTYDEMEELLNNCTHIWTTENDISGRLFTGPNGNSIFLPAAGRYVGTGLDDQVDFGHYLSSSYGDYSEALGWYFYAGGCHYGHCERHFGYSVRPVYNPYASPFDINLPTVTTSPAIDITASGATVSGSIIDDGGSDIIDCGFTFYLTGYGYYKDTIHIDGIAVDFSYTFENLTPGCTYEYRAYATNSNGTAYGEFMFFSTESAGPTSGTLNGYEWIDLGLPSGTKWATFNVGANSPEEYGNYYAWGETVAKETYDSTNYRWCNVSMYSLTKYCSFASYGADGYVDNLTVLEASDDVATTSWGEGWRMPTKEELSELLNCRIGTEEQNGVLGYFIQGPNDNSIFLPYAGYRYGSNIYHVGLGLYYWSSCLEFEDPRGAWTLSIDSDYYYDGFYDFNRYYGFSVRPVCNQ